MYKLRLIRGVNEFSMSNEKLSLHSFQQGMSVSLIDKSCGKGRISTYREELIRGIYMQEKWKRRKTKLLKKREGKN